MPIPFILASASPRRLALLESIGLAPDQVLPADMDETPEKGENPREHAQRLAAEKLLIVSGRVKDQAIILAADTVVACGRRILPKAETPEQVRECLTLLSGRRHHVYTAVAARDKNGEIFQTLSDSRVSFKRLTKAEIDSYVACGEGIGKAGGWGYQGVAALFVKEICGSSSGIIGLPLYETAQVLRRCGMAL